ncbi:hypothetical protein HYFRA_00006512 [Hymenoscyphus fraxineus]|uniref:alpha,alpha-trehalase n=1 Tax=Hymenoscyphus fraxineus TaxID=746836 RepID=A0A9N9KPI1_9HELO|nr:hypothetical protein HYFRA_00006512 [Hymenoscyphus fraxineus]
MWFNFSLLLFFLALVASTIGVPDTQAEDFSVLDKSNYKWNESTWSLTTEKFRPGQYQSRLSLSNGINDLTRYHGGSLAAIGPFFEREVNQTDPDGKQPTNGWPLFTDRISFYTISGFYGIQPNGSGTNYPELNENGWESFISGLPHPTSVLFSFGNQTLDATVNKSAISNFASTVSFKTGVGEWSFTWSPDNSTSSFNVTYQTIFSRERANVAAVKATITSTSDINGTITDLLDGRSAVRTDFNEKGLSDNGVIYTSVHPTGLPNITAYIVSGLNVSNPWTDTASRAPASGPNIPLDNSTIGQSYAITLKAGQTVEFFKYVGVASTDKFTDAKTTAQTEQARAQSSGWDALLQKHITSWSKIISTDSVDDFTDPTTGALPTDPDILALHIQSKANSYYLLQSLQPDGSGLNDNSISVGGLPSDSYGGLIFWDADYWMSPGLILTHPNWVKQIANFRVKQHQQALDNAAFNEYPNGSSLYSWTAGRYGNCTGTGPCVDYEYHLNYDITANILQLYNVTDNKTWLDNGPRNVLESTAVMTNHLLTYNTTTKTYWIKNMTDPDEYANNKDNGIFTIASASDLLKQMNSLRTRDGLPINETWQDLSEQIAFPVAASGISKEYETMNNSVKVKQADVVLLNFPLNYMQNYSTEAKLKDLDYYSNKQSAEGPAMTYSSFSINANQLSPSGCAAYPYFLAGVLSYSRGPWFQFSEQSVDDVKTNGNQNPAFPFLTGHGGANQVVLFGFLGVRTDQRLLFLDPSLPPQIPHIKVRNFHYKGVTLSASMNNTHTKLTRLTTPVAVGVPDAYANTSFPFILGSPANPENTHTSYTIVLNQTLELPNRLYWQNLTVPDNLLQCLPVTSPSPYIPGQFPSAATDGATATRWQPARNNTAELLINMTTIPPQPIRGIFFDWGARPPVKATVYLGNMTDGEVVVNRATAFVVRDVGVERPFDASEAEASGDEVVPVVGNTTMYLDVGGAWTGGFAMLAVEGCREDDGVGATVGEFVILKG